MLEPAPSAPLEMPKADLVLEVLVVPLDTPAQLGQIAQAVEGDLSRSCREPAFGRLALAPRPLDQQPFFHAALGKMGDPVRSHVENWVRFTIAGDMNHPFPMIWASTQKFERRSQQRLILLSPDEYRSFLCFIQSYACPSLPGRLSQVLAIREFSAREVHEV
jgi:hypothetical protein